MSKLSFDEHHVNQERQHNVTETEAKSYIQNAVFSTTKWKGKFTNYYSDEGATFVDFVVLFFCFVFCFVFFFFFSFFFFFLFLRSWGGLFG